MMKKWPAAVLISIALAVGSYYVYETYFSYSMTREGFPIPNKAVLKEAKKNGNGTTFTYSLKGIREWEGLSNRYERQFHIHGWNLVEEQSIGVVYVYQKQDGTELIVHPYINEISYVLYPTGREKESHSGAQQRSLRAPLRLLLHASFESPSRY
ncbi:hypothetical protein NQ117_15490 [Paenibacillus sp. SC116]|uniref:hypothetical protein n=1 Tax=Paenibacillus sp. SC116 TaxID=2968986 RepID=UPI00215B283D|nr:hypothetical protein [Paenibacillus sp. SC116]MCR8845085.1 hypothetical protein [Paenibacillus sp. SC116]